jgi:hypothetical protein
MPSPDCVLVRFSLVAGCRPAGFFRAAAAVASFGKAQGCARFPDYLLLTGPAFVDFKMEMMRLGDLRERMMDLRTRLSSVEMVLFFLTTASCR